MSRLRVTSVETTDSHSSYSISSANDHFETNFCAFRLTSFDNSNSAPLNERIGISERVFPCNQTVHLFVEPANEFVAAEHFFRVESGLVERANATVWGGFEG